MGRTAGGECDDDEEADMGDANSNDGWTDEAGSGGSSAESSTSSSSSSSSSPSDEKEERRDSWKYRRRRQKMEVAKKPDSRCLKMAANNNPSKNAVVNRSKSTRTQPTSKKSVTQYRSKGKILSEATTSSSSTSSDSDSSSESDSENATSSSSDEYEEEHEEAKASRGSKAKPPKKLSTPSSHSLIRASKMDENVGTRSWKKVSPEAKRNNNVEISEGSREGASDESQRPDDPRFADYKSERYHSSDQLQILLAFYEKNHYPCKEDFSALEIQTGLSPKKLLYWFSNRRRRNNDLAKDTPNPRGRRPRSSQASSLSMAEITADSTSPLTGMVKKEERAVEEVPIEDADDQKYFMLQFFKTNPYPTKEEMRQIGDRIGLSEKKVFYWFSNRRRKDKPQGFVSRKAKTEEASAERKPFAGSTTDDGSPIPEPNRQNSSSPGVTPSKSPRRSRNASATTPSKNDTENESNENAPLEPQTPPAPRDEPVEGVIGSAVDGYFCRLCAYTTDTGRPNLLRHFRDTHKLRPKHCKKCRLVYAKDLFEGHTPCLGGTKPEPCETDDEDTEVTISPSAAKAAARARRCSTPDKTQKPQFYSRRYKNLLKELGAKPGKDQSLDEAVTAPSLSPFKRNGKLELVMVTKGQFNAVQEFILGDDTAQKVMVGRSIS